MFSKSNTQQQGQSRQNLLRLLGATLLAATSLFFLAGCSGAGGNGNSGSGSNTGIGSTGTGYTGGNSGFAGSYQGVYLSTSGQSSPDSGTIAYTVAPSLAVTGASLDFAGDGSTNNFTGAIDTSGILTPPLLKTPLLTIALTEDYTTHVISGSVTESNGTKGTQKVGLAPTSSPLAGSYSGTISSPGGQGTMTFTISPGGIVTGAATQGGHSAPLSGYVDANANTYLAYKSTISGLPSISVGSFTLNGASLNGTVQETQADSSSTTITVTLKKQ